MEKNTFLMEELKKMFSVRDLVAGGPCVFPESGGKLHLSVGGRGQAVRMAVQLRKVQGKSHRAEMESPS